MITIILTRLMAESSRVAYVCVNPLVHEMLLAADGRRITQICVILRPSATKRFLFESETEPATEKPRETHVRSAEHRLKIVEKQLIRQVLNVKLDVH